MRRCVLRVCHNLLKALPVVCWGVLVLATFAAVANWWPFVPVAARQSEPVRHAADWPATNTVVFGITNYMNTYSPLMTVRWELDGIRRENALAAQEAREAEEFFRTNTDGSVGYIRQHHENLTALARVDIEFGFRSDGIVVWRVPPERKESDGRK